MSKQKLNKKLKDIVNGLKPYNPEKIIIFGSYATGAIRENSDLDLLVIKNTKKRRVDRIEECLNLLYKKKYLGIGEYDLSIEPIVFTPQEIKKGMQMDDPFISKIIKEGKLIYER
ncbi:MAG: nucleotidyltransferase domain-containing protein [bacterium]